MIRARSLRRTLGVRARNALVCNAAVRLRSRDLHEALEIVSWFVKSAPQRSTAAAACTTASSARRRRACSSVWLVAFATHREDRGLECLAGSGALLGVCAASETSKVLCMLSMMTGAAGGGGRSTVDREEPARQRQLRARVAGPRTVRASSEGMPTKVCVRLRARVRTEASGSQANATISCSTDAQQPGFGCSTRATDHAARHINVLLLYTTFCSSNIVRAAQASRKRAAHARFEILASREAARPANHDVVHTGYENPTKAPLQVQCSCKRLWYVRFSTRQSPIYPLEGHTIGTINC